MTLWNAEELGEYSISRITTDDDELNSFLSSLGCYQGEKIFVVSRLKKSLIVMIKNSRYNIDRQLAEAITVAQSVSASETGK